MYGSGMPYINPFYNNDESNLFLFMALGNCLYDAYVSYGASIKEV